MIVRVFRAITQPGKESEFERMLKEQSMPMVEGRDGLLASYFGRPLGAKSNEFVAITVWRDLDSVKAFAGDDWERRRSFPRTSVPFSSRPSSPTTNASAEVLKGGNKPSASPAALA